MATGRFQAMYPLSAALGLKVIDPGPGFDQNDLKAKIGTTRYNNLITQAKRVFVCNHAKDASGYETPCVYAEDLEAFLKGGG